MRPPTWTWPSGSSSTRSASGPASATPPRACSFTRRSRTRSCRELGTALAARGVEIRGCEETRKRIPAAKPATEADYRTEFLDLILSVKVVDSLDEAIAHIARVRLEAHRCDRHPRPRRGRRVRAPSRFGRGDGQRQHAVQRRLRIGPRRRDRHQHRQVPRPRPVRAARTDQLQVRRHRRRSGARVIGTGAFRRTAIPRMNYFSSRSPRVCRYYPLYPNARRERYAACRTV